MKRLSINLSICDAAITKQSCSLCDIRHPGLREKIKMDGEILISEWAEKEVVSSLIEDCPCDAISITG